MEIEDPINNGRFSSTQIGILNSAG